MKLQKKITMDDRNEGKEWEHMGRERRRGDYCILRGLVLETWLCGVEMKAQQTLKKWRTHIKELGSDGVCTTYSDGGCILPSAETQLIYLVCTRRRSQLAFVGGLWRGIVSGYKHPVGESCGGCFRHTLSTWVPGRDFAVFLSLIRGKTLRSLTCQ